MRPSRRPRSWAGRSRCRKRPLPTWARSPPSSIPKGIFAGFGSWRKGNWSPEGEIMSVKKDASGRRSVQVEVEVPGTPEQVWQAIATGPGVSSWFVPTEGEERVGGTVTAHFGPGMDSVATVTAWEPPRRFAAESGGLGPGAPAQARAWTGEAPDGA